MSTIIINKELKAMKVIDMSTKDSAKEYLSKAPKDSHTNEELDAIHRAINFTKLFKHEESMSKMDNEESLVRPLPRHP